MRNLVILAIIVLGAFTPALAQDELEVETKVDFFSQYIWRGQSIVDDPVAQPSVSAFYKNFTLSVWGNLDMTNVNDNRWDITEVDFSLDYSNYFSNEIPKIGYSIGIINYDFPNTNFDNTTEVYAGINFEMFLSPSLTIYRDIDEADGTYVSFGVSESIGWGFEGAANFGWGDGDYNKFYWGNGSDRFNDLTLSISRPIEFKGIEITPSLSYIRLIDRDLGSIGNDGNDTFVFGISLSKKF